MDLDTYCGLIDMVHTCIVGLLILAQMHGWVCTPHNSHPMDRSHTSVILWIIATHQTSYGS